MMNTLLLIISLGCLASYSFAVPVNTEQSAMTFLNRFGYLPAGDMQNGMPKTPDLKQKAIEYFQLFANITMTGVLDNDTFSMMNMPRCGMPDMDSETDMLRKKRYALGSRWRMTDLTWRIDGWTPDLPVADVDRIMDEALTVWSDVSALTFRRVATGQPADILINFFQGDHNDSDPFDGPGGVLAHAYFPSTNPIGGDAHFDEDETYTDGENSGTNLFQVAAHEFGHSLGLRHSQIEGALMYPYYRGYVPNFVLHTDDVAGIQAHYGADVGQPEEMATLPTPVDDCSTQIKIAFRTNDNSTYLGNETHVYRIVSSVIQAGYPKRYNAEFPGLPDNLDAAFFYPGNGMTYVFKGSEYYRLNNQVVEAGYPRSIAGVFRGVPNDVDAAFIWSGNGGIYFFKGDQYYRFYPGYGVNTRYYPRALTAWQGLPSRVDAAFQYENTRTYFFAGTDYYLFNDQEGRVADGYPMNAPTLWLVCNAGQLVGGNGAHITTASSQMAVMLSAALVSLARFFY